MITMIAAGVLTALLGITFLVAYLKSKNVYDEYLEAADKKDYPFKDFMPLGLYLNEILGAGGFLPAKAAGLLAKYENGVKMKIIELYGSKYADYHLMMHNGNKSAVALVLGLGAELLAVLMGLQGDYDNCGIFLAAGLGALAGMPFAADRGLDERIEKRRVAIQREFPDFVNKLTILVNAGMTISRAWEKIILDNKKDTPLYNEMLLALGEIRAGKAEAVAYEEFGRRCKIKEVIRFVSIVVLNLRDGGPAVVPVLKAQGMECWEMRKSLAKRLGEEAGSKMLMPMTIMLLGVILIVVVPAVMQLMNM